MELTDRLLAGDRRAAARLITLIENGDPEAIKAMSIIYKHTGNAHIVGITGPPGAGSIPSFHFGKEPDLNSPFIVCFTAVRKVNGAN